jgi:hypothetical protein
MNCTGDQQGLGFVVDICRPDRSPNCNHYLVPRATAKLYSAEDLAVLRMKGAFSLPPDEICKRLLQCYFNHVHPLLPILDVNTFLTQYIKGGQQKSNLLLLWSIFFAASSVSRRTSFHWNSLLINNSSSTTTCCRQLDIHLANQWSDPCILAQKSAHVHIPVPAFKSCCYANAACTSSVSMMQTMKKTRLRLSSRLC